MLDYEKSLALLNDRIEERWGQMQFNSSVDINSLLDARTHFTSLFSFLGEAEAAAYRNYQLAEKARKRAFIEAKIKHLEAGDNATVSATKAELDIEDLINEEVERESDYKLVRFRRESAKETLSTLAQLIGVVRQELEHTQFQKND